MMTVDDVLLDTTEPAAFLDKPPRTLETWRYAGRGPKYVKYNRGTVKYRKADLVAFIESCIITPGSNAVA